MSIYSAPLTEQDYSTLGMQPVPSAGGGTTVIQHRTHPHQSLEEQLTSLYSLKEKNLITEDDYNSKKKLVLRNLGNSDNNFRRIYVVKFFRAILADEFCNSQ